MADLEEELRALVKLPHCFLYTTNNLIIYAQGVGGASSAGGVPSTRAEDYSNFVSGIYTSRLSIYILPKGWLGAGMGSKSHPLRRDSFQGLALC